MVYEMPLTTGGQGGRSRRRKRLPKGTETLEQHIARHRAEMAEQPAPEPTPAKPKRRWRWSEVFAAFSIAVIFPAYLAWFIFGVGGMGMHRGAPHFFIFFINLPFCIAWIFLDHRNDPGAGEPLSPKRREYQRKIERKDGHKFGHRNDA